VNWRRVCLTARQCTSSTSRSRHSRAFPPWDTTFHQFGHAARQQSWSKSGKLPHLGHDAGACVSSTNSRYGRVAVTACWITGWKSALRCGRCRLSVAEKTGSVCPCRRSLWTLAVTLLDWHSSCHILHPVLLRAINATQYNWLFSKPPTVGEKQYTVNQMSKVVRWHFSDVMGKSQSRLQFVLWHL